MIHTHILAYINTYDTYAHFSLHGYIWYIHINTWSSNSHFVIVVFIYLFIYQYIYLKRDETIPDPIIFLITLFFWLIKKKNNVNLWQIHGYHFCDII